MASLEVRLQRLEHGRQQPLMVLIRSFNGVIDEPVRIGVFSGGQDWVRKTGESVDAFRRRALCGPHDVGAAAVVVLRERNATGSDTVTQARRERGRK